MFFHETIPYKTNLYYKASFISDTKVVWNTECFISENIIYLLLRIEQYISEMRIHGFTKRELFPIANIVQIYLCLRDAIDCAWSIRYC